LDYKALEYFITTKALTAQQARWADVLSQYNFLIMYRPGAMNCADVLTRHEQDLDDQMAAKISLQTQALLRPERPWQHISIDFHELPTDRDGYDIVMILVDHFGKRLFSIPCYKNIDAKEAA